MGIFDDEYTQILRGKINDWGLDKIYEIEDDIEALERNEAEIIDYLKDVRCSMPLGLALRRYLCCRFAEANPTEDDGFIFTLSDGTTLAVSSYKNENYDIQNDDIKEYTEIFLDINRRYNTEPDGRVLPDISRAEARRLLRVTTSCQRIKMFLLSFALHMTSEDTNKFLTDVLAEQTYNYRQPDEIIAYYCQSHNEVNSYSHYQRLLRQYEDMLQTSSVESAEKENYTFFASNAVRTQINTEEELMEFLLANRANFAGYSRTAYSEFMQLFSRALSETKIQTFSNEEYLFSGSATTPEQRAEREERINRAIGLQQATNTEQLAREMLRCIPRYTSERIKDGKKIVTNDFIPICNGESGQQSKKVQTTSLPKEITMNLLMKDRLDDLIKQIKPVERKDLVFLKFYVFSLDLQNNGGDYTIEDYEIFCDECNDMLLRCGMSRLYPANRFENLIMLSLLASNPFEMFENIIEYSFMNEPEPENA